MGDRTNAHKIKEILKHAKAILREWDPIGVFEMDSAWPKDEYDSYAGPICSLLWKGAGLKRLTKTLDRIEGQEIGLRVHSTRNREFARKLLELMK